MGTAARIFETAVDQVVLQWGAFALAYPPRVRIYCSSYAAVEGRGHIRGAFNLESKRPPTCPCGPAPNQFSSFFLLT
jgi:hypothetical protein